MVCIVAAIYFGLHFDQLDTNLLKGMGILTFVLLALLPVISLISLLQFNNIDDLNKTYCETLKDFVTQKIRFYKLHKKDNTLSYLLLVTIILLSKLFGENDISKSKFFWIFSISVGYIFLLFYSKWVTKPYENTVKQVEDLLNKSEHQIKTKK